MDNIFVITIAAFLSAVLGSMGMGGGGILLIYLTTFVGIEQLTAQGINLIFFIPIAVIALFIHTKNKMVRWKTALPAIPTGIVGVLIGSRLAEFFGNELLSKLFAGFLVIIGIRELLMKPEPEEETKTGKKA